MPHLLDIDVRADHEPDRSFSNHRAAITAVAVSKSTNAETAICISASKDKTCVIWNYHTGEALRTLLFSSVPLCLCLDPCARAVFVATEDNAVFAVEMFGDKALLGPRSEGLSSTAVQVTGSLGVAEADDGPASCIAASFDGTTLLTGHLKGKVLQWTLASDGHPAKVADLNSPVTNLVFSPPMAEKRPTTIHTIVKPTRAERQYTFTAQLETSLAEETKLERILSSKGFPSDALEAALIGLQQSYPGTSSAQGANEPNEELWQIINEQRALQQLTFQKYVEAKAQH